MMTIRVITAATPEVIAPMTKYGGKMVLCQPGTTVTAKSQATIEWTETATGMIKAAIRVEAFW